MPPGRLATQDRSFLIHYHGLSFEIIRLPQIADRSHIEQQVERQFIVVAQDLSDFDKVFPINLNAVVLAKIAMVQDALAHKLLNPLHHGR
jgi:hypothetical protein